MTIKCVGLGQKIGYFKKLENEEQGIEIEMKKSFNRS